MTDHNMNEAGKYMPLSGSQARSGMCNTPMKEETNHYKQYCNLPLGLGLKCLFVGVFLPVKCKLLKDQMILHHFIPSALHDIWHGIGVQ